MKSPFKKRKEKGESSEVAVSAAPRLYGDTVFPDFRYVGNDAALYMSLRDSLPVLDGAINKIVRLTGGFAVRCPNKSEEKILSAFLENINVGGNSVGISSFIDTYLDQLLTCGTALGEMVMNSGNRSFSVYNAELYGITLERSEFDPMRTLVCLNSGAQVLPLKNQEALLFSVLDPSAGHLAGNSILKGLPMVSGILMQIFETIGANWERAGNIRYAVTYKPQNDALDKAYAYDRAEQIAKGWSDAMNSRDEVKDFVAVGDVEIKVIGSDSQILDSEIPVRQLMEQIVAKTGLPPFMLGLNWSTTERMAQQQTDLLTGELWHYRRILTPIILKICKTYLRMNGLNDSCTVEWEDISLMDLVEDAKAEYYSAQAEKYRAEAAEIGKEV